MDHRSGQKRAVEFLYPPIDPFDQRVIVMADGHRIYVEQCGNPNGIPVVVLHGGPGGGCSPAMRRYFDPAVFRVILFDQRGCGRSRPHAVVIQNTTWHLVADIEVIRKELGIDRWICFGGSWGATLALIYAIKHPTRVAHLVLRGVFLMTQAELNAHERGYWENATPIGFIFAFGSLMGLVVGMVIVYQILFSDIAGHLKEYATLKAMGYSGSYLARVVLGAALILACLLYTSPSPRDRG